VLPLHSATSEDTCSCGQPNCQSPGKHPRTPHGVNDATTDEAAIRSWWTRWPSANIGIATGAASGIVVLDIDNRHAGKQSLEELERRHEMLSPTATVRTGGGGNHLFFRHPGGRIPNRTDLLGLSGLDIRGDGGYVVAPPSRHVSGEIYLWEASPDEVAISEMPPWLIHLLLEPTKRAGDGPASEAGPKIMEGQRNSCLASLAGTMRARGMGRAAIEAALLEENQEKCCPPLPDSEVIAIAKSVARYPHSANSANSASQSNGSVSWDPPTPFYEFELPSFPTGALPASLRRFVEAEAVATQTPPDLAAMLTMSVCAASCAKNTVVQVNDGWSEPLNIYTATVQKPGTRKSAVFASVVAPLEQHELDECRRLGPEVNAALTRYNIAKGALEQAERAAAKSRPEEQESLTQDAERLARDLATTSVPVLPRYLADDSSPERLSSLINEQGGRMAVLSPEGGVFDIMAGRYSQNGAPNFEVYLKGHAGDTLRVDRVVRAAEHAKAPALTMGLAIQPQVLQGIVDKASFLGRGLLARFLYSMPETLVGRRKSRQPAVPLNVRREYHATVRQLLELPWSVDGDGERIPHVLHPTADARDRLQAFEEWLEPQLGEDGDLASIADWGSKLAGAVVRLAGILHMVGNGDSSEPWRVPISAVTIEKAIQIGKYLIPHAKAAHALMGADPVVEEARRLLRWITRSGRSAFTKRDIFEGTKGHFKKVGELESPLALLSSHGYVREREVASRSGPGRKPAPIYDVNPYLYSQNSHNSQKYPPRTNSANTANYASPPDVRESASGDRTPEDGEDNGE